MKKIITGISLLTAVTLLLLAATPAAALKPNGPSAHNGLAKGKSDMRHLELYLKSNFCIGPDCWSIIDKKIWGKLTFTSDTFVFNGHNLEPETNYTLIRYHDPWPGTAVCLEAGTTDKRGNIHLTGTMCELTERRDNKMRLVLSEDVDCTAQVMTDWSPNYLLEYNTI